MSDHSSAPKPPRMTREAARIRLATLAQRQVTGFDLRPDADGRAALAHDLGISGIRKLSFAGELTPTGRQDWILSGMLGATVVQPCVVTLVPVTTRIDEQVVRRYMADLPEPDAAETEVPEEDADPLPQTLDLWEVMVESLSLALPPWPRAPGAELPETVVTEEGAVPMDEAAARPFAGLAALRDQLGPDAGGKDGDEDDRDEEDGKEPSS